MPQDVLFEFEKLVGKENLLRGETERELYSYDAVLRGELPSAVLFPETSQQISGIVRICHKNKIPYTARGAGTNLCGGALPPKGGVVIAPTRMKRILSIDPESRTALVEPGLPNLFLKKALEPYGLYYAPDPASQKSCTIGGNIGTNAGGPHCLKYGVTSHHVLGLEIILPGGEIARVNTSDPGYDLTGLFVGSEGTLGIVTQATLNLLPVPKYVETMLVSFPSLESAIQTVSRIISRGIIPATLEAMDKVTVHAIEEFIHAGYPLDAEAVLLIEVDGVKGLRVEVEEVRQVCHENHCSEFRLARDDREREKFWEGRRGSYASTARLSPNVLVEDGAVPRNKLPEALRRIRAIAEQNRLSLSMIFHAGDGNLHPHILFDERDREQTARAKKAGYEMLKACVDLGGTISGEHGIGTDKREAMRWLFTPQTLALFRKIKEAFDPENLCNPDKLIPDALDPEREEMDIEREKFKKSIDPAKVSEYKISSKLEPADENELKSILISLHPAVKFRIEGAESHLKEPSLGAATLSVRKLDSVLEHDVENFTATVQAGIVVEKLQEELKASGQKVLFLPGSTVGGQIASNPRVYPPLRDQVLGMKVVLSDGRAVEFGAKVMKNVAGYDALKLLIGSWGTLGVIVSVILKTYPLNYAVPEYFRTEYFSPTASSFQGKERLRMGPIQAKIKSVFDPGNIFL